MPVTLRAQVINLFDVHGWDASVSSSFRPGDDHRFELGMAANL